MAVTQLIKPRSQRAIKFCEENKCAGKQLKDMGETFNFPYDFKIFHEYCPNGGFMFETPMGNCSAFKDGKIYKIIERHTYAELNDVISNDFTGVFAKYGERILEFSKSCDDKREIIKFIKDNHIEESINNEFIDLAAEADIMLATQTK